MDSKITDKVFEYIDALSNKLGVATELVYEAMIKKMYIEGILKVSFAPGLCIIFLLLSIPFWKRANFDDDKVNSYGVLSIIFAFISIITFIISCFQVPEGIQKIISPEYYAIKEILDTFK